MKAVIKRIYDEEFEPIESVDIAARTCFELTVRVMVGPKDAPGEESFDITVCTPAWLQIECDRRDLVWGHSYLVVAAWDLALIKDAIQRKVDSIGAKTWEEFAEKFRRWARWEFEDYKA